MSSDVPLWRRYLRFWGANPAADVDDEFRFHIEMRVEELMASGLTPQEARARVRRDFGDLERVKRTCRALAVKRENAMRRTDWLTGWRDDVRYGIRQLTANPLLSAVVIVTFGLGIGSTVATFSVMNAVLLRPLPFADSDRIVAVYETLRQPNGREFLAGSASAGHFHDWTAQATVFDATTAGLPGTYNLADSGEPERLSGPRVTAGYFDVLQISPALGRYFSAAEAESGQRVVVLSHGLWQRRFGGDSSIVGREIRLNGELHRVVGVASALHSLTEGSAQLWTPLTFTPQQRANYGNHSFRVLGKLKPGVTREQAQADLERVTRGIAERVPTMTGRGVNVADYNEVTLGDFRMPLSVLLAATGFVLLIGCVNVAGLLLARATTRRKEIAIRTTLGGGQLRIVRQMLTETLVLALAGGTAAIGVAYLGVRLLVAGGPANIPRLRDAGLQGEVLAFAVGITIVTGFLVGLAPALRATRANLRGTLNEDGKSSLSVGVRDRLRAALVVAEVAIAVVLLVGAGLLIRSAQRLQQVPFGFEVDRVLTARLALSPARYAEPALVTGAYSRMLEQIRAIPGVERAGASTNIPLGGGSTDAGVEIDGRRFQPGTVPPGAHIRLITDGYLDAAGIPLVRGRTLQAGDVASGAPRVVVINERLADTLWPKEDPIGKRLSTWTAGPEPEWREVVGVVGNVRYFGQASPIESELFLPYTQEPPLSWNNFQRSMAIVARTAGDPATYAPALRRAVWSVDPSIPLYNVRTMDEAIATVNASRRFNVALLSALAISGLLMAAIGIYGVIAYFVTLRTPEIGLRMALGASSASVLAMVLRHGALLAIAGTGLGIAGALATTRLLTTMLFEISPTDPASYAIGSVGLLAIALLACAIPALRAARVDPVRALTGS